MSKVYPAENQKKTSSGSRRRNNQDQQPHHDHPLTTTTTTTEKKPPNLPVGIYASPSPHSHTAPSILTVWKRSSMSFQGTDGFTAFDHRGILVFRVDNYTRKSWSKSGGGGALLLMDGSGTPLLTLKPQLFSLQHQWTAYRGEDHLRSSSRAFTMRRPSSSLLTMNSIIIPGNINNACEAEIFIDGATENSSTPPHLKAQGSFMRRNCKITTTPCGQLVANISRKRINSTLLLGDDVFTLTVQPGFQHDLVMAFVIILDRICNKSFTPILCS